MQRLILTGIAINSGFGALSLFLSLKMSAQDFESAAIWMAGSIYNANWIFALTMLPWLLILGLYVHRKSYLLDYFQLEEDSITSLGIAVEKEKMKLLLASVGLVSACVSVSGYWIHRFNGSPYCQAACWYSAPLCYASECVNWCRSANLS